MRTHPLILAASLVLTACGYNLDPGTEMGLRFASKALSQPCPETSAQAPSSPPSLDSLDILLTAADGSEHCKKHVGVSSAEPVSIGGIPAGSNLSLQVMGIQSSHVSWAGGADGIEIVEGISTYQDVFMTSTEDVSCTASPMEEGRLFMAAAMAGGTKAILAGGATKSPAECGPGCTQYIASSDVSIFETSTGSIHKGVKLHTARTLATATALPNGEVLVIGGVSSFRIIQDGSFPIKIDEQDLVSTFEVYLPEENRWVEKPLPGNVGRVFHSAVMLADGRVLVTGGGTSIDTARDDAIIFDSSIESTGDFIPLASHLSTPRFGHSCVANGTGALIFGGAVMPTKSPVEEFILDGDAGLFSEIPLDGIASNLFFSTASIIPLRPDEILLAGGIFFDNSSEPLDPSVANTRIYSISKTEMSDPGAMTKPKWLYQMSILSDNTILLAGGFESLAMNPSNSVEIFDPASTFRLADGGSGAISLSTPRAGHACVEIPGGRAVLIGGMGPEGVLASGEIFTPVPHDQ